MSLAWRVVPLTPLRVLRILVLFAFCWFVFLFLPGCSGTRAPINADFPPPIADFGNYIEQSRRYIRQYQMPQRGAGDVEFNEPFELVADTAVPYRGRFLLFHGLNDSPYVWRDMALEMAARGFDVRAVLLPGHGTTPEAQLDIAFGEWLHAARTHLKNWNDGQAPIFLGGFSLGGVLATLLALENPQLGGLLLVSPAYQSSFNRLLRWADIYAKFRPWVFGGMILEDNPAKYNSIPINSAAEYYKLTRHLKRQWGHRKIKVPVLMVVTVDDSVVDVDYSVALFRKRFVNAQRALVIYSNKSADEGGQIPATEESNQSREILRPSQRLDLKILNQSHMSLANSPRNPLYGKGGTQLVCNGNEYEIFFACMRSPQHWYGAQHTPSPDGVAVARTTYNPDFDYLLGQFDAIFMD